MKSLKGEGYDLFANTGFHWNYLAACFITEDLFNAYAHLSGSDQRDLTCEDYDIVPSQGTDTDIALALNIVDWNRYITPSPIPKLPVSSHESVSDFPSVMIIGDSFSDQILHYLSKLLPLDLWQPKKLERLIAMKHLQDIAFDGTLIRKERDENSEIFDDLTGKDWVLIVIYNSNVSRSDIVNQEYGMTTSFLKHLFKRTNMVASGYGLLPLDKVVLDVKNVFRPSNLSALRFLIQKNQAEHKMLEVCVNSINDNLAIPIIMKIDGKELASFEAGADSKCIPIDLTITDFDPMFSELSISSEPMGLRNNLMKGISIQFTDFNYRPETPNRAPNTQLVNFPRYIDLINDNTLQKTISFDGIQARENNDVESWKWMTGPTSVVYVFNPGSSTQTYLLRANMMNGVPITNQVLEIEVNGVVVRTLSGDELPPGQSISMTQKIEIAPGRNEITFRYEDWNHGSKVYAKHDPRHLSMVFTKLEMEAL